jgi:hypothetical protein
MNIPTLVTNRLAPMFLSQVGTLAALLAFALTIASSGAQTTLQISSPASGTVVSPGGGITVTVTPQQGVTLAGAQLIGDSPMASLPLTAPPWVFSLQVPLFRDMCPHQLGAIGATNSGALATSPMIVLDVERPDAPVGLTTFNGQDALQIINVGDQTPLEIVGAFGDGANLFLSRSTNAMYASANPGVVTISAIGIITAVAPGSTQVTVTYMTQTLIIPVTVNPPLIIVPSQVTLHPSQTQQFVANASVSGYTPVTWSINPNVGSIDGTGFYVAPATIASSQAVTVTATSSVNAAVSASATVNLYPPLAVTISPAAANLNAGQAQYFSASVANDPASFGVSWSVAPSGIGTFNFGYYTAPSPISASQIVTL